MNIIKFKDQIHPTDVVFNHLLKGKYAYCVQFRYVVPFEYMNLDDYIEAEQSPRFDKKYHLSRYWDLRECELDAYIDEEGTEEANSIKFYLTHNAHSTNGDLTIDDIRRTRTRIAEVLITIDTTNSDLWDYYCKGMYNDVVRQLITYNDYTNVNITNDCGCSGAIKAFNPNTTNIVSCSPLESYRAGMRNHLYKVVTNIEYWSNMPDNVIRLVVSYLNNIKKTGLYPKVSNTFKDIYSDCKTQGNPEYFKNLDHIIEAFILILEGSDRLNYIKMGLDKFANMYETLEFH